jgi:hypothetical protein
MGGGQEEGGAAIGLIREGVNYRNKNTIVDWKKRKYLQSDE